MAGTPFQKTSRWAGRWVWCAALAFPFLSGQAPQPDMGSLLDKLSQKIKDSFDYKNWRASIVSTTTKTDKSWTPEEVTVVTKNVRSANEGEPQEEILKALETKKGRTTDITQKYAEDRRKEREKARKRRAGEQAQTGTDDEHGGGSMSLDEFLPFSEKKRGDFKFRLQENTALEGEAVSVLDVRAKVKSRKSWEGKFYFDPDTYSLLKVELRPSKYPSMVKELEMQVEFEVLADRYLVLKRTRFKINAGIFIKHIRRIIEDVYSNFEVLDEKQLAFRDRRDGACHGRAPSVLAQDPPSRHL